MNNKSLEEENDISITIGPFLLTNEELGQGNFGIVYKGIHNETKEKVAIKVIRKKDIKVVSKKNEDIIAKYMNILSIKHIKPKIKN